MNIICIALAIVIKSEMASTQKYIKKIAFYFNVILSVFCIAVLVDNLAGFTFWILLFNLILIQICSSLYSLDELTHFLYIINNEDQFGSRKK